MAATVAMAPRADVDPLRKRLISAAILLPSALVCLWLGGPYWGTLVCLFGMVMAWEWARICDPRRAGGLLGLGRSGLAAIAAVGAGAAMAATGRYAASLLLLALGAIVAAGLAKGERGPAGQGAATWQGLGVIYVGLPSVAVLWIRQSSDEGLPSLLWMLALAIAVDSGAFISGRLIGGPKLAPRISPNKTWAGLAGGVVGAVAVGWVAALLLGLPRQGPLMLASAIMALVEQAGDLTESAFKRRFGVKDSSHLIPGHGGLLDRLDGLLAVALAAAAAQFFGGGILAWTR